MRRIRTTILALARLSVGLALAFAGIAYGQTRENFDLLGRIGGPFKTVSVANNRAYLVEGDRLVIVDLTNPAQPVELCRKPFESGATPTQLLNYGSYLYAPTKGNGLQIYDVSNPRAPVYVGPFAPYVTYQPKAVAIDGSRLYFGGYPSLHVFDLANPISPTEIGSLPNASSVMAVNQGRAVLTGEMTDAVKVYDLRDLAHPVDLGQLDFSGPAGSQSGHYYDLSMLWPKIGLRTSWRTTTDYQSSFQSNVYTHTGGRSWTRVRSATSISPDTAGFVLGPNALYASDGYSLKAYDATSLTALSYITSFGGDLRLQGNRLYGCNTDQLATFDATSATTFPLLGIWDSVQGTVIAKGNDRAYIVGKRKQVVVVDIRNPSAPQRVGQAGTISDPVSACVVGQWLYVADYSAGLRIFSLANPDKPQQVAVIGPAADAQLYHGIDFTIVGNKVYVTGPDHLLRIFDISDPTSPVPLGTLDNGPVPFGTRVAVVGNYAYLVQPGVLSTVDVRYPDSPWLRPGGYSVPDTSDFLAYGNYLFVLAHTFTSWTQSYILNVSTPTSITMVGKFPPGDVMAFGGGFAYVRTNGDHVIHAYSIADLRNISEFGKVGFDYSGDLAASGTLVYAVSPDRGLWIMRFVATQRVDLLPVGFGLNAAGSAPGQPIDFVGSVQNLGPSATTQSLWVTFTGIPTDRAGDPVLLCDSLLVPAGLPSGGSRSLAGLGRTLYGPDKGVLPGKYLVAVVVDETNVVRERREDNNIMIAPGDFSVWASLNDLRPSIFNYSPTMVAGGTTISLSGKIEYTGTSATTAGFRVEFWCSPNSDGSAPRYPLCSSLLVGPGLIPGTPYSFSITRAVYGASQGLPLGSYVVGMWVDRSNAIPERDKANNTLWRTTTRLLVRGQGADARYWKQYR